VAGKSGKRLRNEFAAIPGLPSFSRLMESIAETLIKSAPHLFLTLRVPLSGYQS
jgi:hypothetical protein